MQESWVWSLVQELSPCATTTDLHAATTEALKPRAHTLQQEKPSQWEARATQLERRPHSLQLAKPTRSDKDPVQPK